MQVKAFNSYFRMLTRGCDVCLTVAFIRAVVLTSDVAVEVATEKNEALVKQWMAGDFPTLEDCPKEDSQDREARLELRNVTVRKVAAW